MMSSNDVLRMTDTRRLSPQTTSSSGYHSDLSSNNQSPQSIHDNSREEIDKSTNKNFARLSCFLRKQYEKAKLKLLSSKQRPILLVETSCKATSTTALTNNSENHPIQTTSTVQKRSSFIEPVKSIYVSTVHNQSSGQPICLSRRLTSFYQENNSQVHSHSYRRLTAVSNYENISAGYSTQQPAYSHAKPRYSQDVYPYRYLTKTSQPSRTTYVPLSDFLSTRTSAFKPIKSLKRSEEIPTSDDPCDLEVAQYFRHQTSQWSNPNYFDIYQHEFPQLSLRKTYAETLC